MLKVRKLMSKDNFEVSIVAVHGTYREVADRARTTIGLDYVHTNKACACKELLLLYLLHPFLW
jgi:hypothetical protein